MKYGYNNTVRVLNNAGYNILSLSFNEETCNYFAVNKWNPSGKNVVESTDYNEFQGFEITDYVSMNHLSMSEGELLSMFEKKFSKPNFINFKFSNHVPWMYFES